MARVGPQRHGEGGGCCEQIRKKKQLIVNYVYLAHLCRENLETDNYQNAMNTTMHLICNIKNAIT